MKVKYLFTLFVGIFSFAIVCDAFAVDNSLIIEAPKTATSGVPSYFILGGTAAVKTPYNPLVITQADNNLATGINVVAAKKPLDSAAGAGSNLTAATGRALSDVAASSAAKMDIPNTQTYKGIAECMRKYCMKDDFSPKYYNCYNRDMFDKNYLACVDKVKAPANELSINYDSVEELLKQEVVDSKADTCKLISGIWTPVSNDCQVKVLYTRKEEKVEKLFSIGSSIECSFKNFGLAEKREADDSGIIGNISSLAPIAQQGMGAFKSAQYAGIVGGEELGQNGKPLTKEEKAKKKADEKEVKQNNSGSNVGIGGAAKSVDAGVEKYAGTTLQTAQLGASIVGVIKARKEVAAHLPLITGRCSVGNNIVNEALEGAEPRMINVSWYYN